MNLFRVGPALVVAALASCAQLGAQQLGGEQSVAGSAGAIYVDDGGGKEGLPVIFLHSFAGDSGHWSSQLARARHQRRALAMDLRGHGKSAAPPDNDYAVESLVKDLGAVVDKLQIRRFVLVGHSMGAAVAIKYAGAYPKRVAGLVLAGAPGKIPAEQSAQVMGALQANYDATMKGYWEKLLQGAQPNVRTQLVARMDAIPKEATLAILGALFKDDPLASLDRYPGPKLVVYTPSGDTPNDLQNVRPAIPRKLIAGTSHWPHLDKPGEFTQVLDEFLAAVR